MINRKDLFLFQQWSERAVKDWTKVLKKTGLHFLTCCENLIDEMQREDTEVDCDQYYELIFAVAVAKFEKERAEHYVVFLTTGRRNHTTGETKFRFGNRNPRRRLKP